MIARADFFSQVALGAAIVSALLGLGTAALASRLAGRAKWIFSVRLLLWPFHAFSLAAQAGIRIVHGLEYWFIYRKIESKRRYSWPRSAAVLAVALLAGYAFVLCFRNQGVASYFHGPQLLNRRWLGFEVRTLAYAFYGATNLSHILLDSFLFRMSRAEARAATLRHIL